MLLLKLRALFDPPLCRTECPLLEFADQLWVEGDLLGSDGVQVANAVHVSLGGSHVQWRVVVVVQTPHIGTESHQEGEAVVVAIGSCQVKWRVAPDVGFVRVTSGRQRRRREVVLLHSHAHHLHAEDFWTCFQGWNTLKPTIRGQEH